MQCNMHVHLFTIKLFIQNRPIYNNNALRKFNNVNRSVKYCDKTKICAFITDSRYIAW